MSEMVKSGMAPVVTALSSAQSIGTCRPLGGFFCEYRRQRGSKRQNFYAILPENPARAPGVPHRHYRCVFTRPAATALLAGSLPSACLRLLESRCGCLSRCKAISLYWAGCSGMTPWTQLFRRHYADRRGDFLPD